MTLRADKHICINAPPHSTALVQDSFDKKSHRPGLLAPIRPKFGCLRLLGFPKFKIAAENEEICECGGYTVHKLSQLHLTAD
jgi:hypothetical protein